MKTILIQVGKTVNKHFIAGISDYVERINHYMPFDVVTIPELKNTKNLSEEQQKQAEGELILRQLQPTDTVVLLDEHGREYRSIEFASWLEQKRNTARRLVFVIGGPYGDTGLTGRKIIVDTYGGRGAHGGGAFSGKDPSKVDRSAAYAARYIAKNMVAAGVANEVLVQISYAIGVAKPVSLYVNTYRTAKVKMNDAEIAKRIGRLFDLRPAAIIRDLKLTQPMYEETARYGHMGRTNEVVTKSFIDSDGKPFTREVELFTWEKLDRVDAIKQAFKLS